MGAGGDGIGTKASRLKKDPSKPVLGVRGREESMKGEAHLRNVECRKNEGEYLSTHQYCP